MPHASIYTPNDVDISSGTQFWRMTQFSLIACVFTILKETQGQGSATCLVFLFFFFSKIFFIGEA